MVSKNVKEVYLNELTCNGQQIKLLIGIRTSVVSETKRISYNNIPAKVACSLSIFRKLL